MEQAKETILDLIGLNKRKAELLDEIFEITRHQKVSISTNSLNSLLDNIKKKQEVMDSIDSIDRSFYSGFLELKELLGITNMEQINPSEYPDIAVLKLSVNKIMMTLEAIEKIDGDNVVEVKQEIEKVKDSMREVQSQKKVFKGYGTMTASYGTDSQGYYIDGKK